MYRHPYFDLYLHDDDEIGALLSSPVQERLTLQEWPLSCVQRISTAQGRKLIYKAQHKPTVEPDFYASARSPLLVSGETIYCSSDHSAMFIEYVEGPTLEKASLGEAQVHELGLQLTQQINQIAGKLPFYLDLSTEQKWREVMVDILHELHGLVGVGTFQCVDVETVNCLERWAFDAEVLAAFHTGLGYVHHDLNGDNVFLLSDGPRVIDWQRPILGPVAVDRVTLLESLGFDPLPWVGAGPVCLAKLLRVSWFTECAVRWFPEGREAYDRQIAGLAASLGAK